MRKSDITPGSDNVFLDLGFSPEESQNLFLRSRLMSAVKDWFESSGLTQASAAKRLMITQPRLNSLLKGRIVDFSLDALVAIASSAGLQVLLEIKPVTTRVKQAPTQLKPKPAVQRSRKKVA